MIDEIRYDYADFKVIADKKKFFWQLKETPDVYTIWGYDFPAKYCTSLYRTDPHLNGFDFEAELVRIADFEENFKADCNRPNTISPTSAQTQFYGKTIELLAEDTAGYCEWSFDTDTYVNKVLPMPIEAQKGDYLTFEVWARAGVAGPDPVKVGQYGYDIPIRGSYPLPWVYGSGGGEIKSYCTVRCYYHKVAGTPREFNIVAEFLV